MNCEDCGQPLEAGQACVVSGRHLFTKDCVSAAVRRCAEVVRETDVEFTGGPFSREDYGRGTLESAAMNVLREFGLTEEPKG